VRFLIYTWANNKHKGPHYLGISRDIDSEKLKLSLLTEKRKALHKTPSPGGFVKAQKEGRQRNQQTNKNPLACANHSITCTIIVCVPPPPHPL
jgi:hypothetical protein